MEETEEVEETNKVEEESEKAEGLCISAVRDNSKWR